MATYLDHVPAEAEPCVAFSFDTSSWGGQGGAGGPESGSAPMSVMKPPYSVELLRLHLEDKYLRAVCTACAVKQCTNNVVR